jgi:syntaxin-binding protein 1
VVDEHSQRLLNTVLKQFDILQENVTLIDSISNARDPQPQFEAIYLIMPTSKNIDLLIRDFSNGNQQYAAAHLFFVDGPSILPLLRQPELTHTHSHSLTQVYRKLCSSG